MCYLKFIETIIYSIFYYKLWFQISFQISQSDQFLNFIICILCYLKHYIQKMFIVFYFVPKQIIVDQPQPKLKFHHH